MYQVLKVLLPALLCAPGLAAGWSDAVSAEGVIKGGTVIIAPGTDVEGLDSIRQGPDGDTIEIDCTGGKSFKLATGTGQGTCSTTTGTDGAVQSARCDDGGGNAAVAMCTLDAGKGACSVSIGLGTCRPL